MAQPEKRVTRASKTMIAAQPKKVTQVKDGLAPRSRKRAAPTPSQLSVVNKQTTEDIDNAIESLAQLKTGDSICVPNEGDTEGEVEKLIEQPAPRTDFNPTKKRPTRFGQLQKIHQMSLNVFLNRKIDE